MPKGTSFLLPRNSNLCWRRILTGLPSRQPVLHLPPFLQAAELNHLLQSWALWLFWLLCQLRLLPLHSVSAPGETSLLSPSSGLGASPHSLAGEGVSSLLSRFFCGWWWFFFSVHISSKTQWLPSKCARRSHFSSFSTYLVLSASA